MLARVFVCVRGVSRATCVRALWWIRHVVSLIDEIRFDKIKYILFHFVFLVYLRFS